VGFTVVTTLMALATLEHGFLMLPLPSAALWQWSLPGKGADAVAAPVRGAVEYATPPSTPSLAARSRDVHESAG
jgi:hypothetical protein